MAKRGRKPLIEDEIFLGYPWTKDPAEMAKAIRRDYSIDCTPPYAKRRMEALGMEVNERKGKSEILEHFFEKYPNLPYDGAVDILEKEYGVKNITNIQFDRRRSCVKRKGIIEGMKDMREFWKGRKKGGRPLKIPEKFFEEHPNMPYNEAVKVLEEEYGVTEVSKDTFTRSRTRLKGKIKGIKDLRKWKTRVRIPERFFERHPNLPYNEAAGILEKEYDIADVSRREYNGRRNSLKDKIDGMEDLRSGRSAAKKKRGLKRRGGLLGGGIRKKRNRGARRALSFEGTNWKPVKLNELTKAIMGSVENGMEEKAAMDMAEYVMDFFGYSFRIIDNVLNPEDRDVFYMLEDTEILKTSQEEVLLYNGKEWRIHYWLLDVERVRKLSEDGKETKADEDSELYSGLSDDVWKRKV